MASPALHAREVLIHTFRKYIIPQEDQNEPTHANRATLHIEDVTGNRALLDVRHSLGQRVKVRLNFDVLVRDRGKSVYKRMASQALILDCPNPEQAELAIEAILSFAQSLDGIWLAPPTQAIENKPVEQSAGDSQAIGETEP